MIRRQPRSTLTDTLFPYTTLFRSFRLPDPHCYEPSQAPLAILDGRSASDQAHAHIQPSSLWSRSKAGSIHAPTLTPSCPSRKRVKYGSVRFEVAAFLAPIGARR